MKLESSVFFNEGVVPPLYTCEEQNISPPLNWSDVPEDTETFALIVEDPDAPSGTFNHWIAYNIPPSKSSLPEQVPPEAEVTEGFEGGIGRFVQGRNDFGRIGYGGPCPPVDHGPHRYIFRLYALDTTLDLSPGATRQDLEDAMEGHIIDEAVLMGRYER